ncbi:MAG: hypothetical protein AVDCRST_MAG30-438, partial [uncultured Solirubrobacteraceae bacterium]
GPVRTRLDRPRARPAHRRRAGPRTADPGVPAARQQRAVLDRGGARRRPVVHPARPRPARPHHDPRRAPRRRHPRRAAQPGPHRRRPRRALLHGSPDGPGRAGRARLHGPRRRRPGVPGRRLRGAHAGRHHRRARRLALVQRRRAVRERCPPGGRLPGGLLRVARAGRGGVHPDRRGRPPDRARLGRADARPGRGHVADEQERADHRPHPRHRPPPGQEVQSGAAARPRGDRRGARRRAVVRRGRARRDRPDHHLRLGVAVQAAQARQPSGRHHRGARRRDLVHGGRQRGQRHRPDHPGRRHHRVPAPPTRVWAERHRHGPRRRALVHGGQGEPHRPPLAAGCCGPAGRTAFARARGP